MKTTIHKSHKTLVSAIKDLSTGDIIVELPDELTKEDLKDMNELMSVIYRFMTQEDWRLNHDN